MKIILDNKQFSKLMNSFVPTELSSLLIEPVFRVSETTLSKPPIVLLYSFFADYGFFADSH